MTNADQFYADREAGEGVDVAKIDLSIAYQIQVKAVPEQDFPTSPVGFYCRDCRRIVPAKKAEKGVRFSCTVCSGKNIVFGTVRSLSHHFRLNDQGAQKD